MLVSVHSFTINDRLLDIFDLEEAFVIVVVIVAVLLFIDSRLTCFELLLE